MRTIKIELGTAYVGVEKSIDTGIPADEWDTMTEEDKHDLVEMHVFEFVYVSLSCDGELVEI